MVKLGKLDYRHDDRTLQLAKYVELDTVLTKVPAAHAWSNRVARWPMYLNDRIGDCTCAEVGHGEQLFSALDGREIDVADNAVLKLYEQVSGYNPNTGANDNGAVILDVMNAWRKTGIGGHKIGAFAEVDIEHDNLLKAAIYLFAGVSVGLALPLELQAIVESGMTTTWNRPRNLTGKNAPGSWGGHCVLVLDYDHYGLTIVTWGALQRISWGFWHAYADEAWAALSTEWLDNGKTAPNGVDIAALNADLHLVAA